MKGNTVTAEEVIRQNLPTKPVMQLATCANNQPWTCNVHYYSDDGMNLYWISDTTSRHSKEIAANNKVSAIVMVHVNSQDEPYLIGIAFEGTGEVLNDNVEKPARAYAKKHPHNAELVEKMLAGEKDELKFYKITPSNIVLFDTKNFKGQSPRQEWIPTK